MPVEAPPLVESATPEQGAPSTLLTRRDERRLRRKTQKADKKLAREIRVATNLHEINEKLHPGDEERFKSYIQFVEDVRLGVVANAKSATTLATMWNEDYNRPRVRRRFEMRLREVTQGTGREFGKLKKIKFSSIETCLDIVGRGDLPTTVSAVERMLADAKTAPEDIPHLTALRDQLKIAKRTKGRHSSGAVIEAGVSGGYGLSGTFHGGLEVQQINPGRKRRRVDVFVGGPGGKLFAPGLTPVKGRFKKGLEKYISVGGVTWSKDHPYRGPVQRKVKTPGPPYIPSVGVATGELNGGMLDIPLAWLAPAFSLVGAHDVAVSILSLGPTAQVIRSQVLINIKDERLGFVQEALTKTSARMPRIRLRRNGETAPAGQEEKVLEPASVI